MWGFAEADAEPVAIRPFLEVKRSATGRIWRARLDPGQEALATAIGQRLGTPDLLARVLAGRGVAPDEAVAFLAPSLRADMPDPLVLADMDKAAARLAEAVTRGEAVTIFGDYDVDGATSAALMFHVLAQLGYPPRIYIPDRIFEGYGPNPEAVDRLADDGTTLIVAVDCGSTSFDALERARARGVDVVVIDHHQIGAELPPAVAVVNPNRQDDMSGLGGLAAVGVTFLVAVALVRELRRRGCFAGHFEPDLLSLLDLVALGTVCDIVPLAGLNRAFVVKGLAAIRHAPRPGLAALAAAARLKGPVHVGHLGFLLGPRINAGGRIGDASLGARLLTTTDMSEAERIAALLERLNGERQAIEAEAVAEATAQADARHSGDAEPAVLVAEGKCWHPGVLGLVAARLKERFGRPAVAVAFEPDAELGTGSARSTTGVDIGAAVRAAVAAGHLERGGGHAMAAGLTVRRDKLPEFRAFLDEQLGGAVATAGRDSTLLLDGATTAGGAMLDLIAALERAGPFGSGHPAPVLAFPAHRISYAETVGGDHVRASLSAGTGSKLKAIAFRAAPNPLGRLLLAARGRPLHVAGTLEIDHWGGSPRPCLRIVDAAEPVGRC
jgi:single-stranded-DNA-specific exonuclease